MSEVNKLFPLQRASNARPYGGPNATCRESVYMAAYEVYCHLWGPQEALVTGGCRGGFSTGELIAMLYAKSFPKDQWRVRFDEALSGLQT